MPTLTERFEDFHRLNPWVLDRLLLLGNRLLLVGRTRIGIGQLFEVLRYQHALATHDPHSEFKLNNSYRSRYARLMIDTDRRYDGVILLRELHTE